VKALLEYNADPNQTRTNDGATPAFVAAQNGHAECFKLEHDAKPNQARTSDGATPILHLQLHQHPYRNVKPCLVLALLQPLRQPQLHFAWSP